MWCHLCKINFTDIETFKCHIMEKHKPDSSFYKDSDCEESSDEDIYNSGNSDLEINNKDPTVIFEDDELSSESSSDESRSKSSTPEPSTSNPPKNQRNNRLRRSSPIKKPTSQLKSSCSSKGTVNEEENQNNKNSEPAVNSQLCTSQTVSQGLDKQPLYVITPPSTSQLNANGAFALNSKNILQWLTKHKELCNNLKYPLPPQLYKKVKMIHKELLSHYCLATPRDENGAILKVCEDLNDMILRHIECINAEL